MTWHAGIEKQSTLEWCDTARSEQSYCYHPEVDGFPEVFYSSYSTTVHQ